MNVKLRAIFVLLCISIGVASSTASSAAISSNISHSYNASGSIKSGTLVSLDRSHTNYVIAANQANAQQLLGVALESNNSLLAVDSDKNKVQIATSGTVNTLVSTVNGSINVGDQVSVSGITGAGKKAEQGDRVIGLAQTSFSRSTPGAQTESVKIGDKTQRIYFGLVRINIGVGVAQRSSNSGTIQGTVQALLGHTVSPIRLIISLFIALISGIALVTLIYVSIYSSIISIGRNPLAKYAVFRALGFILGMVFLLASISCGIIFILLK